MPTNKRKVMLPHTMGPQGIDIVRARDDIETVIYPAGISQAEYCHCWRIARASRCREHLISRPKWMPLPRCSWWRASASATTR